MRDARNPMLSLLVNATAILIGFQALVCQASEPDDALAAIRTDSAAVDSAAVRTALPLAPAPADMAAKVAADPLAEVTAGPAAPQDATDAGATAIAAAVADGVTTTLALSAGAIEMNPLVTPTPMGLLALTGGKILLVKYAERLPEQEKRLVLKSSSALWGGAAVNNLMVLVAAPPPFPVIAGIIMGFITWSRMQGDYETQDRLALERNAPSPSSAGQDAPLVAQAGETPHAD